MMGGQLASDRAWWPRQREGGCWGTSEKGGACQWSPGCVDGSWDVQKGAGKGGQDVWVGAGDA